MVAMSKQDSDWASHCLSKIAFAWQASDPTNAADALGWIVCNSFLDRSRLYVPADVFLRLLKRVEDPNPDFIAPTPRDVLVIFDFACVILHNYQAKRSTDEGQIEEFDIAISTLLEFVSEAIPKLEVWLPNVNVRTPYIPAAEGIELNNVLKELFINPHFTYPCLYFFSRHSQYLSPDNAPNIFSLIIVNEIYHIEKPTAISILDACATFFEENIGTERMDVVDTLRLCDLIYRVGTDGDREFLDCWHKVFHNAGACIDAMVNSHHKVDSDEDSTCQDRDSDDQKRIYRLYVKSDAAVEEEAEKYLEWCSAFDVDQCQIPDKMVDRLRHFVCAAQTVNEGGWKFWRVRRLEDLEKKQSKNTSPNMLSDPANGSAGVAATVPIAKFPTARRRAKSLFETFNSDFEYMHLDPLAPHHVPHADSAAVAEARPHALTPPGTAATAPMSTSATTKDAHEHSQGTFYAEKKSSRPSHSPPIQTLSHTQPATGSAEPHVATHSPEMPALLPTEQGSDPSQQPAAAPRCSDEALPAAEPASKLASGSPSSKIITAPPPSHAKSVFRPRTEGAAGLSLDEGQEAISPYALNILQSESRPTELRTGGRPSARIELPQLVEREEPPPQATMPAEAQDHGAVSTADEHVRSASTLTLEPRRPGAGATSSSSPAGSDAPRPRSEATASLSLAGGQEYEGAALDTAVVSLPADPDEQNVASAELLRLADQHMSGPASYDTGGAGDGYTLNLRADGESLMATQRRSPVRERDIVPPRFDDPRRASEDAVEQPSWLQSSDAPLRESTPQLVDPGPMAQREEASASQPEGRPVDGRDTRVGDERRSEGKEAQG